MSVLVILWYHKHQSLRIGNNCTIKKKCFGFYVLQLGQIWYQDTGKKINYVMHRKLTCSLKHWWVKPVFTSHGCSSIRAPACLLLVQLSSAERGCPCHCSLAFFLAKRRNIFPLLRFAVQGMHLWTECCLRCLHPLLSLGAWYTRHFPGNTTCTGIAVPVLVWEGEVTLWRFCPSAPTFLNAFKQIPWFLSAPVPQLINGDCELQPLSKALQIKEGKMLHES